MSAIEFIEGPLWDVAIAVFVIFAGWRLLAVLISGRSRAVSKPVGSPSLGGLKAIFTYLLPRRAFLGRGKVWFVTLAGYAFHLGLFALLLFAAPHVTFIREHFLNVEWPVLPRWGFIVAGQFAFAGLLVLWIRRFIDPVVRLISRPDDHIATGLTFLLMFTGCMALGEKSVFLRALHLSVTEIWLIYFPFSSLMHTFIWPLSRGVTGSMAGRRGTRI